MPSGEPSTAPPTAPFLDPHYPDGTAVELQIVHRFDALRWLGPGR